MSGEEHKRPDRRAHGEIKGQEAKPLDIFMPCRVEIAIEQPVRGDPLTEVEEVHERKGEVVENVGGGDDGIELDRVEQHRPVVDKDDIAEMGIAVTAPHKSGVCALPDQGKQRVEPANACRVKPLDISVRKRKVRAKLLGVAVDDATQRRQPG